MSDKQILPRPRPEIRGLWSAADAKYFAAFVLRRFVKNPRIQFGKRTGSTFQFFIEMEFTVTNAPENIPSDWIIRIEYGAGTVIDKISVTSKDAKHHVIYNRVSRIGIDPMELEFRTGPQSVETIRMYIETFE